jgi:putative two-component system response regulator
MTHMAHVDSRLPARPVLAFADPFAAMAQFQRYAEDLKHLRHGKDSALHQLEKAHLHSLTILARAAEYRDDDTGVHMERVGALSSLLAQLLGHSEEETKLLALAAPMHDVGKIAIPDAVLKKPGQYTLAERAIMNNHAVIGAEIIGESDIPLFSMAAQVALTHHEYWNGAGYPLGLAGTQIPWCGRVVAIIDFFDALTMDRVYRKAFSDERTQEMMLKERGKKFDPEMLDVFLAHLDRFVHLRDAINVSQKTAEQAQVGQE